MCVIVLFFWLCRVFFFHLNFVLSVFLLIQTYLSGVNLSFQEVEKLIVRAVKQRQVKVTVDHKVRTTFHVVCLQQQQEQQQQRYFMPAVQSSVAPS